MEFELAPQGNHLAVCYMVCDLGYHETDWQGTLKAISARFACRSSYQVQLWKMGDPSLSLKNYTLSLSDKANLQSRPYSHGGAEQFTERMSLKGFDLLNVC